MDKSNPMCVEYYTMKLEFQGRGAGHNHGTLWVNIKKLEYSFEDKDGSLIYLDDVEQTLNKDSTKI